MECMSWVSRGVVLERGRVGVGKRHCLRVRPGVFYAYACSCVCVCAPSRVPRLELMTQVGSSSPGKLASAIRPLSMFYFSCNS